MASGQLIDFTWVELFLDLVLKKAHAVLVFRCQCAFLRTECALPVQWQRLHVQAAAVLVFRCQAKRGHLEGFKLFYLNAGTR